MIQQLVATTVAIPIPDHRVDGAVVWQITPTASQSLTFAPDGLPGQIYILKVVTSGTSTYTLTFSTGFKTTGTLATGTSDAKVFTVSFISDGQQLNELARTAAM
jgi:hypothetical protein